MVISTEREREWDFFRLYAHVLQAGLFSHAYKYIVEHMGFSPPTITPP